MPPCCAHWRAIHEPLWTRKELETATGGTFLGNAPVSITGISIDTRSLAPGDLFIALKGDNSDGHAHIATALEKVPRPFWLIQPKG